MRVDGGPAGKYSMLIVASGGQSTQILYLSWDALGQILLKQK